jgi:uncharacterized protein (TIRG00374 family)
MPDGMVRQQNGAAASEAEDRELPKPPGMSTEEHELESEGEPSFFTDPGQITKTLLLVGVLVAAIYILVPKLAGLNDAIALLGEAQRRWIAIAILANVVAFGSYVALFRGVISSSSTVRLNWQESYQVTMAGLAATRLFSAGGAGGIVLTYWALRKAGMKRRESARRMVAFLVLLYAVYIFAVILFGILLRTGVLPGKAPLSMTIVPAVVAGVVLAVILLISRVPADLQQRFIDRRHPEGRMGRLMVKVAALPETLATGIRTALEFIRDPSTGWVAMLGAIGFWAANVMIIWASFKSLGVSVPLGEVVIGFFVGMVANLAPAPAGVGAVDGGLIGSFAIFGYPLETVIAAVLIYRLIAFYMPVPPGIIAFFQLRGTVSRWEQERRASREAAGPAGSAPPITS